MAGSRFICWGAVGVLFMLGCITPTGFLFWIPAAVLAAVLIGLKIRSPRFFFAFASGIGITLIGLGIVNSTYLVMVLFGIFLTTGGIVFYSAFGPRTSHADPPSGS